MAYGNAGQSANAAITQEATEAERLKNMVAGLDDRAGVLCNRLFELKSRAFGNEPDKEAGRAAPSPVPVGSFEAIRMALQTVAERVEAAHNIVTRLERIT